jgi:hypothetical protein
MRCRLHHAFTLSAIVGASLLAACEMLPAELLDRPRLLAIRAQPAGWSGDEPVALEAFAWDLEGPVRWSTCPTAFAPTEPVSCPGDAGAELGEGAVVTFSPGADVDAIWVKAEADGALPAVRLLRRDPSITNPPLLGLSGAEGAALPDAIAPGETLSLAPRFVDGTDGSGIVTSWYVTAGELEPARTVGDEVATWSIGDLGAEDGDFVTVVAVSRTTAGGTAWATHRAEVRR